MTARRSLLLSLALPIVALALMVLRGEIVSRSGKAYRLAIEGYDPRDIVRGQYLRYRIRYRWDEPGERCTAPSCSYCLRGPEGGEPLVTKVSRGETAGCDAWFPADQEANLQQFFIPEDRGAALGIAIRQHRPELSIRVSRGGQVVIQDLLLDGRPWREIVR